MEQFYYYGELSPNESKLDKYEQLIQYAERTDLIAVDTETISKSDRTCIGVGIAVSPNDIFYFPTYPTISPLFPNWLLESTSVTKVFHNAPFDLDVLDLLSSDTAYEFDYYNVRDTAVMARLLMREDASLEWLAWEVGLPYHETAASLMNEYGVKTMIEVPESAVALHCCKDARLTYLLYKKFLQEIDMPYFITEMALIPILHNMSKRGLKIDKEYRDRLEEKLSADLLVYKELAENYGFNPGSSQQVGYVIAKRGTFLPFTKQKYKGYDFEQKKKKLHLRTDKETLEFVDDPLAAVVINYRKTANHLKTYVLPLAGEDRVYTHFHLDAVTGRISSGSGDVGWSVYRNLQNIPPATTDPSNIRGMILPDTGHFTDADWSQIQLRVLAHFSQDPQMLWIYDPIREGTVEGDIHQATADFMHIPRKGTGSSKNVNFAMIFGATPQTLRETSKIRDITICESLIKLWAEKFPVAWSWIMEQQASGLRQGYVETILGRKIRLPTDEDEEQIKRKAVNYPIMGSEAEIIKRAMLKCSEMDMALQVHDELIFDGLTILPEGLDHITEIYTPFSVKVLERWE